MDPGEPIPAQRLAWLEDETERWRADGLVSEQGAAAIRARYAAAAPDAAGVGEGVAGAAGARADRSALSSDERRPGRATPRSVGGATTLVVTLGGLLVAVGIVLLVAANVDYEQVGPLARFLAIAAIWLAAVAAAELGVVRIAALRPLRGPLRALAVAAYGATIFQAAQSLQVPSFEAGLIAAWSLGSLAYAYAVSSVGALVLAIAAGVAWYAFALDERVDTGTALVLGLALPVPLLLAVAAAHARTSQAPLGAPWRVVGALLGLAGLFLAAIPGLAGDGSIAALPLVVLALGVAGCGLLALRGNADDRFEATVAVGVALAALGLAVISPSQSTDVFSAEAPEAAQVLFTLLAIAAFVAGAVALAVLGIRRGAPQIADAAAAALFAFVVLQSFGFLAPLASGAVLVLALGVVLVAGGVLVDRGRRRLREEVGR